MCGLFGQVRRVRRHDLGGIIEPLRERAHKGWGTLTVESDWVRVERSGNYWSSAYLPMSITNAIAFLGHLRASTAKDTEGVACSHPFNIGPFYLAHNGILVTKHEPVYGSNVDSARLLHAIYQECLVGQPIEKAISWVLSRTDGQHACWMVDAGNMTLYLWRSMAPLWVEEDLVTLRFGSLKFSDSAKQISEGVIYKLDLVKTVPELKEVEGFTTTKYYEVSDANQ